MCGRLRTDLVLAMRSIFLEEAGFSTAGKAQGRCNTFWSCESDVQLVPNGNHDTTQQRMHSAKQAGMQALQTHRRGYH